MYTWKKPTKPYVWGACHTQSWYFFSELGNTLKPSVKQHTKFTPWKHLIYKHSLNCYPAGRQSFNFCCNNKHSTCNILLQMKVFFFLLRSHWKFMLSWTKWQKKIANLRLWVSSLLFFPFWILKTLRAVISSHSHY